MKIRFVQEIDNLKAYREYSQYELLELPFAKKLKRILNFGELNPNESDIKKCKDEEGKRVLAKLKPSSYIIGLDLNKKEMDSIEFAKYIDKKMVEAKSHINFVIGGSYGLSDELKNRLNDSFSLSKMTFLHQMTRLILLEQIYRALKINRNETYHK